MFHFVAENLKELYRTHADAALARSSGRHPSRNGNSEAGIFQYGDWFDRYPSGVSRTDYEDPAKKTAEDDKADDGVLGAKEKNLLSIEEFFVKLEGESLDSNVKVGKKRATKKTKLSSATKNPKPTLERLDTASGLQHDDSPRLPQHHQPDMSQPLQSPGAMAMPLDSGYGPGTSFLPNSDAMSTFDMNLMAAQQTPTTPNGGGLDVWGFSMSGFGNMNGFTNSGFMNNSEWYMPWNMEPPLGFDGSFNGTGVGDGLDGLGLVIDGMGGIGGHNES